MAKYRAPSEAIPELKGHVDGGGTLIVESQQELDAVITLCRECRQLGLAHLSEWFPRFTEWFEWFEVLGSPEPFVNLESEAFVNRHPRNLSDVERVEANLHWVRDVWRSASPTDVEQLLIVVSIGPATQLTYVGEAPVLFLYDESIEPSFAPFVPTLGAMGLFSQQLGAFAVGLSVKLTAVPTIEAEQLVVQLRARAREHARFPDVPTLADLTSQMLEAKKGVIVLLHGLFSTDLVTFDGFIGAWRNPVGWDERDLYAVEALKEKWFARGGQNAWAIHRMFSELLREVVQQDYVVVGWPHDTLAKIADNARDLVAEIVTTLPAELPVVLVCHSRGGLVARKAAAILHDRSDHRIKLCVTFGTPHRGAELAEHTLKLAATYVMVMAGTRSVLSLPRVLAVYGKRHEFPGIEDLRPDSRFLSDLVDEELRRAPGGRVTSLEVRPVGAEYRGSRRFIWNLVSALLRTREHDLVVRCVSSMPRSFAPGMRTTCSHSGYFDASETEKPDFAKLLHEIRDVLGVEDAMLGRAAGS